jgi:flagellar biogenesis protein FliO
VNFMTTETLRVSAGALQARVLVRVIGWWERVRRLSRRRPRRLRLCESLPLGERRFVAVVEFDQARFLVGGTPSSLVLLSRLSDGGAGVRDQANGGADAGADVGVESASEGEDKGASQPEKCSAVRGPGMPWRNKC